MQRCLSIVETLSYTRQYIIVIAFDTI
jgi:hypothetical protein